MNVKQITEKYLKENEYDGLCTHQCGCRIGDLMPCCQEGIMDCVPGYLTPCDPETCPDDGDCPWHISAKKP